MTAEDEGGRYSMIGLMGEDLGVVLMRLLLCSDCGAIVGDTTVHDRWHEESRP